MTKSSQIEKYQNFKKKTVGSCANNKINFGIKVREYYQLRDFKIKTALKLVDLI